MLNWIQILIKMCLSILASVFIVSILIMPDRLSNNKLCLVSDKSS